MVDVTAVIMAATNTHRLRAADEPFRWRRGEVHPYSAERGRSDNPRFYLLHLTGCPGPFAGVKAFLLAPHEGAAFPGPRGLERGRPLARRRHLVSLDAFSPEIRRTLETQREIEMRWRALTGATGLAFAEGGVCRQRGPGERPMTLEDR